MQQLQQTCLAGCIQALLWNFNHLELRNPNLINFSPLLRQILATD